MSQPDASQQDANNDYSIFIRRRGPMGWQRGRRHHQEALLLFVEQEQEQQRQQREEEIQITVPHMDGGNFMAWFHRMNPVVCQYRDEYGAVVDIMMSSSGQAAFANRIVDHY